MSLISQPGLMLTCPPSTRRPDRGATAVEYALMVALIAIVIFGAVAVVGLNLGGLFNDAATSFENF